MKIRKSSKRPVRAARSGGAGREVLSNDWVIQKIGNRWYLLSRDEFSKYEDHLSDFPKDLMVDSFPTKVSLIQQFLREPAYKGMFEESGYSLDENWNVVRSSLNSSVRASRNTTNTAKRRVMAAYDDDPNFGDIAGLAKESAYSYIVIARQGFERLLKFVDEVLNDEFNSTYRTAGTESPGDTDTSAIFTITPVSDGELLEDSALNIYYDVFGVEVGRFAGRPYRMVVKAAINDDVIAYGDTFDDIQVEVAQDIAESCRADWDEFWGDDIESSTKIAKRPIKASRPIMAGPGAGYTVEWDLNTVDSVKFIKPISTEVNEYGEVCVDAECDIEIGLTINAASSYYEGADSLDLETTATISRIYLEIPVADYETSEDVIAQIPYMGATDLDSIFYDIGALGAWKSNLGGGYIHSTFNGVLADADDPHSVSEGMDGWTITLTDKEVIDYIDQVVTGEDTYTGYALYDQDGEYIDKFENLMDAQNKAEELIASGEYESIECVREDTKIYFDGTSEEVYNETEFVIDEPADI